MNVNIISVGNIKEKYFIDAIKEYSKRLKAYVKLNIIEVGEYRLPNNPSPAQIEGGMLREGEDILNKLGERSVVIALCIEGKVFSSEEFSDKISNYMVEGYGDISFVIGGSNGLSREVKKRADLKLSFSKMTYPHQLMRLILLEQIYRAFKIMKNEPYHK